MPVIKSAQKKLRQDKKRERANDNFRTLLKSSLKAAKKSPTNKNISGAFKVIDKLAKKHIIHKNKAARLKSSLSKLIQSPVKAKPSTKSSAKKSKKK